MSRPGSRSDEFQRLDIVDRGSANVWKCSVILRTPPPRSARRWGYPWAVAAAAATTTALRRPPDRPSRATPARLSRVRRSLHGTCCFPRYARARPAPAARWSAMSTAPRRAASARITPSLRSAAFSANQRFSHPRRYAARSIPCQRPPPGYGMLRAGEKSTHHAKPSGSSHAQT